MRGYTMVELIVVMLLITILSALALPRLLDRGTLNERGFRDQLKTMLEHGRRVATVQERDVCVLIGPAQARAVYTAAGACSVALPVAEPAGQAPFVLPVPAGVVPAGALLVRFNARGQPVPNAIQIITLGSLALNVSRETGFVR